MESPANIPDVKLSDATSVVKSGNMLNGRMAVGVVLVIIAGIVFFIWTMYKRMKRLESQSKETQKMNNEMTNLKYAVQETINNVDGLRRRAVAQQQVPRKTRSVSPVPVPVPAQKKQRSVQFQEHEEVPKPKVVPLVVEEVDDDDVDGVSEVIEVEEDSEYESESDDE